QLTRATKQKPARLVALKSDAGVRDVYLLPRLEKILRAHRATAFSRGRAKPEDLVFQTESDGPYYYRNLSSRGLDKAANRAGLNPAGKQKLSMHDLRHSYISQLIASGLDVVTVQRQAGHAKPSITLDRYA